MVEHVELPTAVPSKRPRRVPVVWWFAAVLVLAIPRPTRSASSSSANARTDRSSHRRFVRAR